MATTIGRNVRRIRKQSGLSQALLAELAGISQSWISKIETSDENPTSRWGKAAAHG
jgi:transcriptional regulator with XRE-family HTH domain